LPLGIGSLALVHGNWATCASAVSQALLSAALLHVCFYYAAWTLTDLRLKVTTFRVAWAEDRRGAQGSRSEASAAQELQGQPWILSDDASGVGDSQQPGSGVALDHPSDPIAEELSVCVQLCGWLDLVQFECLCVVAPVGLLVLALVLKSVWFLAAGVGFAIWRCCQCRALSQGRNLRRPWLWTCLVLWEPELLQEWGKKYLGLSVERQSSTHAAFAVVVLLQGVLFAVASQWVGLLPCSFLLACVGIRHMMLVNYENSWGWLVGICEGILIWLGVTLLNVFALGAREGLLTFLLACSRQFGLAHHNPKGTRLVTSVTVLMYTMLFLVVGAVLSSAKPSERHSWTAFQPGGKLYPVSFKEASGNFGLGLACEGRFACPGCSPAQELSLGDFGLLSAVAYESDKTMKAVLGHYFPRWYINHSRVATQLTKRSLQTDWTTFFEYVDAGNQTSVISIRGTDTALDVLNDLNIWLPACLMQGFTLIGPWLSQGMAKAIGLWSHSAHSSQPSYSELLAYVQRRLKEEPQRRFYIAGHSLGGGLAKLVASQVGIQAVTFMAPGLAWTGYISLGEDIAGTLRDRAVTLQPAGDMVSRVDVQVGLVVPLGCEGGPLACHHIYSGGICNLYSQCGSMRRFGPAVKLPCSQCSSMPC
ncbi:unnamed protein product, partial [Polarella glacialis]